MEAHSLPEALNLIMEQRGCSGSRLARELGVSQSWLSDAARGKKDTPTAKAVRLLASVGWELVIRPKREEEDPVKRREFVAAAASVTFIPSSKVGPYEDPANVRALARRIAGARFEHGGGAIASTAIRHIQRIEPAITGHDRKLQEAASMLAVQTTWTLNDACRINAGENAGRLALKLAKASDNSRAQARAYEALISLNLDHGAPDRALMYANKGLQLQEIPDLTHAWMRLKKGWALAHIPGQKSHARDEVETVRGLLQDTHGFNSQSSSENYSGGRSHSAVVADMIGNVGLSLSDLGIYDEAQASFNECVHGLEESSSNTLAAFFLAHQVQTALKASHVPLAAERMQKLARILPLVNSPRLDRRSNEVLKQSAGWAKEPRIRAARDHLKAVASPDPRG
jgi:transcriptional regulator with XRE-family HTH domain